MTQTILLYLATVLTLSFFPGPDMLFIISQSLNHGKRYGVAATLGIASGCFVHIFAVTAGLSAFILKSSLAFAIIKYLGAAYLIYLGLSSLLKKQSQLQNVVQKERLASWKKSYMHGFLTNVLNPKVALFFLAFLPQFINPDLHYAVPIQILFLGLVFNLIGSTVNLLVALFFGSIKNWLFTHGKALKIQQKVTGFILLSLGLRLATFEIN